ncbi:hypothetical protein OOZ54_13280 [Rhodopseudomonas palustris]|uniref:hypothetical protein n=1 Tax=Rhodopseudomonas palustris TaxID=1076 RepID=UPI0022F03D5A|nr:hypothetical protein [Rhodopseudomonas palustris]WBU27636.1 hypothetical protein OOZ54_13280 [Rhodopseudomonas palustris]
MTAPARIEPGAVRAVFLCRLASAFQRGLEHGEHRVDGAMRRRAWEWWSSAQALGVVLG